LPVHVIWTNCKYDLNITKFNGFHMYGYIAGIKSLHNIMLDGKFSIYCNIFIEKWKILIL